MNEPKILQEPVVMHNLDLNRGDALTALDDFNKYGAQTFGVSALDLEDVRAVLETARSLVHNQKRKASSFAFNLDYGSPSLSIMKSSELGI